MADCVEGVCLDVSMMPSVCDEGEWCAREDGCVPNFGDPIEQEGCENDPRLNRVCAVPGRPCWYGYWTCVDEAVICAPFHTYPVGASCGTNMYCDAAGECGEGTPCPAGYTGTVEMGCEDINECEEGVDGAPACDPFTTLACSNTPGSFACTGATDILQLTISQTKQFDFDWTGIPAADTYNLLMDPDGASGYSIVASGLTDNEYTFTEPLHFRVNARYALQVCIGAVCETVDDVSVAGTLDEAVGYFKANASPPAGNAFGSAIALSGDGQVLAVGAPLEDSDLSGVLPYDGAATNSEATESGAVYLFRRRDTRWRGTEWVPEAFVKAYTPPAILVGGASNQQYRIGGVGANHLFGWSVGLSFDGSRLVVGAPGDSASFWVRFTATSDFVKSGDSVPNVGGVYTYDRDADGSWQPVVGAYVSVARPVLDGLTPDEDANQFKFGGALALSSDGRTHILKKFLIGFAAKRAVIWRRRVRV